MIRLDGSFGEGGGQIVRTALALSTITGKAFEVSDIRKGRSNPGLKTQHVNCVKALKDLCEAKAIGDKLGSDSLQFFPSNVKKRSLSIDFGTAGSITLFLQALLPVMSFSDKKVKLTITGGSDVTWSPQIDYLREVIIPQLRRFNESIQVKTLKRGYYPKGGGIIEVSVSPKEEKSSFNILEQGDLVKIRGISHASNDLHEREVADRTARAAEMQLKKLGVHVEVSSEYVNTLSTGSGITLWASFSKDDDIDFLNPVILGSDFLGERGVTSEEIGEKAANHMIDLINSKAPVDEHLADNLIPYMALAAPSKIVVNNITEHVKTNIYVTENFLDVKFSIEGNTISCQRS